MNFLGNPIIHPANDLPICFICGKLSGHTVDECHASPTLLLYRTCAKCAAHPRAPKTLGDWAEWWARGKAPMLSAPRPIAEFPPREDGPYGGHEDPKDAMIAELADALSEIQNTHVCSDGGDGKGLDPEMFDELIGRARMLLP